jgi:hypothetical protein
MSNGKVIGTGLTFMQVLFLVFLVLKLTETSVVATWSWWWITAPLWGGVALFFAIWVLIMVIMLIAGLFSAIGYIISKK